MHGNPFWYNDIFEVFFRCSFSILRRKTLENEEQFCIRSRLKLHLNHVCTSNKLFVRVYQIIIFIGSSSCRSFFGDNKVSSKPLINTKRTFVYLIEYFTVHEFPFCIKMKHKKCVHFTLVHRVGKYDLIEFVSFVCVGKQNRRNILLAFLLSIYFALLEIFSPK